MSEKREPEWFVMNAYAKSEHKAESALQAAGNLPYFIPKHYVLRTYHGKRRRELVPLIPNLFFVHAPYQEVEQFQKLHPNIGYATTKVDGAKRILKVPEREMNEFIAVARHYEEDLTWYRPEEVELSKGVRVRIIGGVFEGAVGTLLKLKGKRSKRLVVSIPDIITVAAAHIEPEYIQILSE